MKSFRLTLCLALSISFVPWAAYAMKPGDGLLRNRPARTKIRDKAPRHGLLSARKRQSFSPASSSQDLQAMPKVIAPEPDMTAAQ